MSEVKAPYVAWEGVLGAAELPRYRVVVPPASNVALLEVAEERDAMGGLLWKKSSLDTYQDKLNVGAILMALVRRRSTWDRVGELVERLGAVSGGPLKLFHPTLTLRWYDHDGIGEAELHDGHGGGGGVGEPTLYSGEILRGGASEALLVALEELWKKWEAS